MQQAVPTRANISRQPRYKTQSNKANRDHLYRPVAVKTQSRVELQLTQKTTRESQQCQAEVSRMSQKAGSSKFYLATPASFTRHTGHEHDVRCTPRMESEDRRKKPDTHANRDIGQKDSQKESSAEANTEIAGSQDRKGPGTAMIANQAKRPVREQCCRQSLSNNETQQCGYRNDCKPGKASCQKAMLQAVPAKGRNIEQ